MSTYPSFIVQLLGVDLARSEFDKITISALDHHIGLALSSKHGLGRLTTTDDALVLHVGIPESRTKGASRGRDLAVDRLGSRIRGVDRVRGLDDKEVDALKRPDEALT